MDRKAEMGVGTLIIFIAMLLVAAVAAGVLIQTVGSLQEKAISTGSQAKSQISTNAETVEISATDGRDTDVEDFEQLMKLSPGSDPIKLDQVIIAVNTKDYTGTLRYKGTNGICAKNNANGFNTWNIENITTAVTNVADNYALAEDLDDDNQDDYIYVYSDGTAANDYLYIHLSSLTPILNISLGVDVDTVGAGATIAITNAQITDGTTIYGYVTIGQTTTQDDTITAGSNFIVTPYNIGQGYFTVDYEQQSTNWVSGNLQRGDLIKVCYEGPKVVGEDEMLRINFIPKIGTSTLTEFVTPEVMSTYRVYLYP